MLSFFYRQKRIAPKTDVDFSVKTIETKGSLAHYNLPLIRSFQNRMDITQKITTSVGETEEHVIR